MSDLDPSRNREMSPEMRLKLDRRIHNQRRALRENWMIVEKRHWYQKTWPHHNLYMDHFQRLHKEIAELRRALQERVIAERGEFYRVMRVHHHASAIEARQGHNPKEHGAEHESAAPEADAQQDQQ